MFLQRRKRIRKKISGRPHVIFVFFSSWHLSLHHQYTASSSMALAQQNRKSSSTTKPQESQACWDLDWDGWMLAIDGSGFLNPVFWMRLYFLGTMALFSPIRKHAAQFTTHLDALRSPHDFSQCSNQETVPLRAQAHGPASQPLSVPVERLHHAWTRQERNS